MPVPRPGAVRRGSRRACSSAARTTCGGCARGWPRSASLPCSGRREAARARSSRPASIPALRAEVVPHSAAWSIASDDARAADRSRRSPPSSRTSASSTRCRTRSPAWATTSRHSTSPLRSRLRTGRRTTGSCLSSTSSKRSSRSAATRTERAAFLANLSYAATIPGGRTVVVVTLRADFYDRCAPLPGAAQHARRLST